MRKRTGGCVRSYEVLQLRFFLGPFVVEDAKNYGVFACTIGAETNFAEDAFSRAADLFHRFLGPEILTGDAELDPTESYLFEEILQQQ